MIRHVHINEMDGRHPGTGKYDFVPVLKVLKEKKYTGWVSLEVFDFKLGAERIAREAIEYIRSIEPRV
jgi:sugar phosphate isomerase/epimerase